MDCGGTDAALAAFVFWLLAKMCAGPGWRRAGGLPPHPQDLSRAVQWHAGFATAQPGFALGEPGAASGGALGGADPCGGIGPSEVPLAPRR